jgi:ABC-type transport system involved in cytochrome bd biosynthesis fused ATPase/permease subunit
MEASDRLMQGRTSLMIAHRLSTLEHCDARFEIEYGKLLRPTGARLSVPTPDDHEPGEAVATVG